MLGQIDFGVKESLQPFDLNEPDEFIVISRRTRLWKF